MILQYLVWVTSAERHSLIHYFSKNFQGTCCILGTARDRVTYLIILPHIILCRVPLYFKLIGYVVPSVLLWARWDTGLKLYFSIWYSWISRSFKTQCCRFLLVIIHYGGFLKYFFFLLISSIQHQVLVLVFDSKGLYQDPPGYHEIMRNKYELWSV